MCKPNQTNPPLLGRFINSLPGALTTLALGLLCSLSLSRASAQTCITCPADAQASAIGASFSIFAIQGNQTNNVSGGTVGACNELILVANVSYNAFGQNAQGQIVTGAGFTGGTGHIILPNGTAVNVTPVDMATTTVGPVSCANTTVKGMNTLTYTLTPADIASGSALFTFQYTNGTSLLTNQNGQCILKVQASPQQSVSIAPLPTCSIAPASQTNCQGTTATFTFTGTLASGGPFTPTYCWQKGCPPAGSCLSTSTSLTLTNVQLGDAGCYTVTVVDSFGCTTNCSATLVVNPTPSCVITPTNAVCGGTTNVYTSNVSPTGGTVTHSWTISGNGTILGATNTASVTVVAGASGSFTLVDNITRDTCPGQCTVTIPINPNPTCNITGPAEVCEFTTNTYTSTILPPDDVLTHNWQFVGSHPNAFFVGPTTNATVEVGVGGAITSRDCFSLTDAVTRDGCPGSCTNTFCLIPCKPGLKVYKQVVCYTNICEPFSNDLNSQKTATGVSFDGQCPAFCYRIVVTNTGDTTLSNVTVSDLSSPGPNLNLSSCFPTPFTLAPAGQPNSSASCIVPDVTRCANDINVVTATGTGQNSPTTTTNLTAQDTNTVLVIPINVACSIQVSTNGVDFFTPSGCAVQSIPNAYVLKITVTNNGSFPLQNVTLVNVAGFDSCFSSRNLGSLNTNSSTSVLCTNTCTTVSSNYFAASVSAQASQSNGHICAYTSNGIPVTASSSCNACVECIGHAAIKVYKQVVCYTNICEPFDSNLNNQKSATGISGPGQCPAFCYRITVTNLGIVALTNVTVSDLSVPGPNLNLSSCFPTPFTLAPAGQPNSSATCIVPDVTRCASDTNVVTATGTGFTAPGQTQTVSATDTNRVTVIPINVACNIQVSTNGGASFGSFSSPNCATVVIPGSYIIEVTVTNTGSYPLGNVVVTSTGSTPLCFSSMTINLPLNGVTNIFCTNTCSATVTNNYAFTVSAQADQTQGHVCAYTSNGLPVTVTAECETCVTCLGTPCIGVTKQIACFLGSASPAPDFAITPIDPNAPNEHCGTFGYMATGVQATNNAASPPTVQSPAFCYAIQLTNCGNLDLTNVTVVDSLFGDLTTNFFPTPGTVFPAHTVSTLFHFKVELPGTNDNETTFYTNVVTVQGFAVPTGQEVTSNATAVAQVVPAAVICTKYYTINGGAPTNNAVLPCGSTNSVVWYVGFTNVGRATLLHGTVFDGDAGCLTHFAWTNCLQPGEGTVFAVCSNADFVCTNCFAGGLENTVTVLADVFTLGACTNAPICAYDINGSNIVAGTTCSATLSCAVPTSCRVTGGGRQDLSEEGSPICPPDVRYVTHGGQVGAPVGNKVCSIDTNLPSFWLGNPCIHGRWTHVRHVQGGLEGNFHARFFDTLDCACLDTNFLSPNTCQYGPATTTDGICGNRNIGPEPRKAPANKIVFTGVGDWACPNGERRPRACLFRVDIEDRGEPGNDHVLDLGHKKGRVPDRYRIRIWVLSDAELAQLNSATPVTGVNDPYLLNFRNCISACNGIDFQDGTCQPRACVSTDSCTAGGAACVDATTCIRFGNATCSVRLPNIDDGGELLHGNHQIHPSIKACDPFNPTGPGLAKP